MRFITLLGKALFSAVIVLGLADVVVRSALPHTVRLNDNFSAAYLRRAIADDSLQSKIVFLGDSVLWGYRIGANQAAVSRLIAEGVRAENLSFEGGSLVNTYALLRVLQASDVKPAAVAFNVNLKEFNAADSAYKTLYPPLEQLAWPVLSRDERALLNENVKHSFDSSTDAALSKVWALYGMRADLREMVFKNVDAASAVKFAVNRASGEAKSADLAHVPTPDKFLGTYDLTPLSDQNVEVVFLKKTLALLRRENIPAYVVLTPANHTLLHDYIDTPDYDAQLAYVSAVSKAAGARVVNLDRAFHESDFIDNDHLTAAANVRFAALLRNAIAR